MANERLDQEILQDALDDCYIDTVSRDKIEKEAERYVREHPEVLEYKPPQRYTEVLCQAHTALPLSQEEKMRKTDFRIRLQRTMVGFFRTTRAILYCLLAVPGAIFHVLFSDKQYKV